jgi:hypothetical protein
MFKRKYSVSILNENWEMIKGSVKLTFIPRANELLYFNESYYNVINVIHCLSDKQGIFLIVKPMEKILEKKVL